MPIWGTLPIYYAYGHGEGYGYRLSEPVSGFIEFQFNSTFGFFLRWAGHKRYLLRRNLLARASDQEYKDEKFCQILHKVKKDEAHNSLRLSWASSGGFVQRSLVSQSGAVIPCQF